MTQTLRLASSNIVSKALLAVTGMVWFGFVIIHMLGNLQVFLGPEVFNAYPVKLRSLGALLWLARIIMASSIVTHIWVSMRLVTDASEARPVAYRAPKTVATTYAARTMRWSGPILGLFIVFHLIHFTWPGVSLGNYAYSHTDLYSNFVHGFSIWWVTLIYVTAQVLLGMHLYHGGWSLMQSLGLSHPRYNGLRVAIPRAIALTVVAGNIAMPLAVLFGGIKL
jgi:succinate dehydrogenase / fumarate reductase, cytochrome b subunit